MSDFNEEREVVAIAADLLERLYGAFAIDPSQNDRPDAALILTSGSAPISRIGVEVTSVDHRKHRQYFNDKSNSREDYRSRIDGILKGEEPDPRPVKKAQVEFHRGYIADGVRDKDGLYSGYKLGGFDEVILLATSEYLTMGNAAFKAWIVPQTRHLLSLREFPFEKVIFVCKRTRQACLLYDKNAPQLQHPDETSAPPSVTVMRVFGHIGQPLSLNDGFDRDPSTPRMKKAVRKR